MIVSEQLNYIKTRRFHAIFMSVIIEFSRCIGTYSSAKFEFYIEKERDDLVFHTRQGIFRERGSIKLLKLPTLKMGFAP